MFGMLVCPSFGPFSFKSVLYVLLLSEICLLFLCMLYSLYVMFTLHLMAISDYVLLLRT